MKNKTYNIHKNKRLEQMSDEIKRLFDENPSEFVNNFLESLLEYQFLVEKHRNYIDSLPSYEQMKQEYRRIRTEYFDKKSKGKLSEKELQEIDEWKKKNRRKFNRDLLETFLETK